MGGNYTDSVTIGSEVEDFHVTKVGLAILHIGSKLALPGGMKVDLQTVDLVGEWTIITRAAKQWIVSSQQTESFKLACFNSLGRLRSSIDIQSIYRSNIALNSHTLMLCVKTVVDTRRYAQIIAIERQAYAI